MGRAPRQGGYRNGAIGADLEPIWVALECRSESMCIFIGDLYLYLYLDLRSSAVSRRRRPQPPSGPVRPRTRPWSLARSIHALGAAAVATRGAPADRRDPLAHPEPPTRRPCRRCALSAGGLVPAGTDRAGAGRRPLRGRCSIAGIGERLCHSHSRGGRPASRRQSPASLWPRVSLRSALMRHAAEILRWSRLAFGPCCARHAKMIWCASTYHTSQPCLVVFGQT